MASTRDPRNPILVERYGVPQVSKTHLEANSMEFKAGEPVYLNAGAVTESDEGASRLIWGLALTDATNVTSGNIEIPIEMIGPNTEIQAIVSSDGTIANAEAADTTCAPGVSYDLVLDSGDLIWTVDSADTTNPTVVFIDAIYDAAGAATTRGRFRLLESVRQTGVGS